MAVFLLFCYNVYTILCIIALTIYYELKNDDRIIILNDSSSKSKIDWIEKLKTSKAKK